MKRRALLLLLAALAAACEPPLPPWDGSASVRLDGTVRADMAARVDAVGYPGGNGQISLRTVGGKDTVSSVYLELRFDAPLNTGTRFPRFSGDVLLIDGQLFRILDEAGVGSARANLVSVSPLKTKYGEDRYEVHGTMQATYVQVGSGRTVEMIATF